MAENGTNIFFKLHGKVLAGETSSTFTSNKDEIELSDKNDGADSVYTLGRGRREIAFEMNWETSGDNDLNDLWDYQDNNESVPFIWGGVDSGDFVLTGDCKMRDLEFAGPDNERTSVTGTARVTGAVTKTTYS